MFKKLSIYRAKIAILRWKLHRIEADQREAVNDLMFAIDYRMHAQRDFAERSHANEDRKQALRQQINALRKEPTHE